MNRCLKIVFLIVIFAALALPALHYFGAKETWRRIYGWETIPKQPELTLKAFADRSYQSVTTEHFSKEFFLRHTFYTTARQLSEVMNLGLFHDAGFAIGTLEGKPFDDRGVGVIYEYPYIKYHLECPRPFEPAKYAKPLALLKEMDEFCRTNGADFVFLSIPDKPQTYPDYLPDWIRWAWNYDNFPIQTYMAKLCNENGVKTVDGLTFFNQLRAESNEWLYPPGGTHLTAFCCSRLQAELVRRVNAAGRIYLENNPLVRVEEKPDEIWSVDNDISLLLNSWYNPHVDTNLHFLPVFSETNVVKNAGSAFLLGDCYCDQMMQIFRESGLFAKDKVMRSKRQGQKPADLMPIAADLKLVVLVFQSFNSGRLDERYDELNTIFSALRTAVATRKGIK